MFENAYCSCSTFYLNSVSSMIEDIQTLILDLKIFATFGHKTCFVSWMEQCVILVRLNSVFIVLLLSFDQREKNGGGHARIRRQR